MGFGFLVSRYLLGLYLRRKVKSHCLFESVFLKDQIKLKPCPDWSLLGVKSHFTERSSKYVH